jgi:hypothetical protein
MPDKDTLQRVRRDRRQGKAPSTQAGEFIREEVHHIREGKHGARSAKQAVAIGLSKARRAGVELSPPKRGTTSAKARRGAERASALARGATPRRKPTDKRARASEQALKRERHDAASHAALAAQTRRSARRRSPAARSAAAHKGASTRAREQRDAG